MIKKFQTPAGRLAELPEEEKLKITDNVPIIEDYEHYEPIIDKPKWDMQDYSDNMTGIRNRLNGWGITSFGLNSKASLPGKVNPGTWLANWNSNRGDLTYENMIQTRKPSHFPSKHDANNQVVESTARALSWKLNPNNDHTQQLGEIVEYQGITPAVKALAKQFGISESEALNKYKEIMQFRYNARVNPRERNVSLEKINSTIDAYDALGVFDGMSDDLKNFIFNGLAYNEKKDNTGTAFAKQGKKLIPKRKKGKLC